MGTPPVPPQPQTAVVESHPVNPLPRPSESEYSHSSAICDCGCGRPLRRTSRRGRFERRFASNACRAAVRNRAIRQRLLDFSIPAADPRLEPDERPRLETHNAMVLARLRQGPATGPELDALLSNGKGGSAWRTRVSNVRRALWPAETIRASKWSRGVYSYRIEAL
jgi:hypothetical protein